jgi:exopolyphosphatase/guanosine-5'-triphosphate,3'-diphosphate pyrophosphatase
VEAVADGPLQGLAPLRASRTDPVLAALDLGTNNCRLLIARPLPDGGFRIVDAFSRIVRLGEGVALTGRLAEPAMVRTLEALRVCAAKMRRRGVTHARCVATEACRRAANCADFVARARRETGIRLEIITARQEAELAFAGCAPLLDPAWPHAVVFDIGGGSTEIGWIGLEGCRPELVGWQSIPIGVVSLAERHGSAPVPAALFDRMVGEVTAALGPFAAAHGIRDGIAAGRVQMLGTSGTVTTLAGVHLGLPRYDRSLIDGCHLDFAAIRQVSATLAAMDCATRAAHPCIGRDRADLVVAGCAILEAICRLWPVGRLRVADRGVREGILLGLSFAGDGVAAPDGGAAPRFA